MDLPDTWQEARQAFRASCEEDASENTSACLLEEGDVFEGQPLGEEAFRPSAAFCEVLARQRLAQQGAVSLLARRLKSGGAFGGAFGGGGKVTVGSFSSSRSGGRSYGYTSSRMGTAYPAGYRTTSYGYSGNRPSTPLAVIGGATVGGLTFFGATRFRSFSGANPDDCQRNTDACRYNAPGHSMVRDDLMNYGFVPSEVRWPLSLNVSRIRPGRWGPGMCDDSSHTWDLFFALAPVDSDDDENADWALVFIVLLPILCCACSCWYTRCSKRGRAHRRWKLLRSEREGATPLLNATVLTGGPTLNMSGNLFVGPKERHQLQVSTCGLISGQRLDVSDVALQIYGRVTWDGSTWLRHAFSDGNLDYEVKASITLGGFGEAQIDGEFIACKPRSCRPIGSTTWGQLHFRKDAPATTEGIPMAGGACFAGDGNIPVVFGQAVG